MVPKFEKTFVSSDGKTWSPESIETFEYDEKGRMVSDLHKWDYQPWNSGQERLCGARKETYQYNEKGKLIKSVTYDTENGAPDAFYGNVTKVCTYGYSKDKKWYLQEKPVQYGYKYDKDGTIIEKVEQRESENEYPYVKYVYSY